MKINHTEAILFLRKTDTETRLLLLYNCVDISDLYLDNLNSIRKTDNILHKYSLNIFL